MATFGSSVCAGARKHPGKIAGKFPAAPHRAARSAIRCQTAPDGLPYFCAKLSSTRSVSWMFCGFFRPVDWPAPAAVIPAVLTAGRAVQIEQQLQTILVRLIQCKVYEAGGFDVRLWRFQRPIANRQTHGIQAVVAHPPKIFGGDECFTMPVQPASGLVAQGETEAVFIRASVPRYTSGTIHFRAPASRPD